MPNPKKQNLGSDTLRNIADALWVDDLASGKLPAGVRRKLTAAKNSPRAFGERFRSHLDWLLAHPQSHNPDYRKRYETLKENTRNLTPHQAYVISSSFLGLDNSQGYEPLPTVPELEFPRDHAPKWRSQVGWHFFVGSAWADDGQEYGIECMFFRYALLPPELAAKHGLSEIENQVIELQLGISEAGGRHYQADPVVIAGTTGLIDGGLEPFHYELGRNRIRSQRKNSLWPLRIEARGVERGGDGHGNATPLAIDLTFTGSKGVLKQGDDGACPAIAGMGTLYYSFPELVLKTGSRVSIGGRTVTLRSGRFWFDHQWGFLGGNPDSAVLRAVGNTGKPKPGGWDWFMAQLDGNRELTMFAMHDNAHRKFYFQTGPNPPGTLRVPVGGKYLDPRGKLTTVSGMLTVDRWVRAERSPNPRQYPATHTWHPDRWIFEFDKTVPADIRSFTMTPIVDAGQANFFANGVQYAEGAVYLRNPGGAVIGRGFAESVMYADTMNNVLALAGLDPSLKGLLTHNTDSLSGRLKSLWYVLRHKRELAAVLKTAKGLDALPAAAPHSHSRHRSRYGR